MFLAKKDMEYNFIDIEEKWQENWEQSSLFCVDENSKKPKILHS